MDSDEQWLHDNAEHVYHSVGNGRVEESVFRLSAFSHDLGMNGHLSHRPVHNMWSPLALACANGDLELVKDLIDQGATVDAINPMNGWTPLLLAAFNGCFEVVRYLVDSAGASVNSLSKDGETPLSIASDRHPTVTRFLRQRGAKLPPRKQAVFEVSYAVDGHVAPLSARQPQRIGVLESSKFIKLVRSGQTGSTVAYLRMQPELAKARCKDTGLSAVAVACSTGNLPLVEVLLQHGADLNVPNKAGWTPLMLAVFNGHLDIVKLLLTQYKTDVNCRSKQGTTPLMQAALQGRLDMLEVLCKSQADPNLEDQVGDTALIYAAKNGHLSVCRYLVDRGLANVAHTNRSQCTALIEACRHNRVDVVRYLLQQNAESISPHRKQELEFALYISSDKKIKHLISTALHALKSKENEANRPKYASYWSDPNRTRQEPVSAPFNGQVTKSSSQSNYDDDEFEADSSPDPIHSFASKLLRESSNLSTKSSSNSRSESKAGSKAGSTAKSTSASAASEFFGPSSDRIADAKTVEKTFFESKGKDTARNGSPFFGPAVSSSSSQPSKQELNGKKTVEQAFFASTDSNGKGKGNSNISNSNKDTSKENLNGFFGSSRVSGELASESKRDLGMYEEDFEVESSNASP
eukprot:GILK01008600.1.p1 GENE.GILK01008600.1~~GILK01008600.1.p1  ORF type:complete len:636 (-),score=104.41 GILK01008600.1:115-2022(-)